MQAHIDYEGVAILIGALGTFVTVIVGTTLQIISFFRGTRRDEHLAQLTTLVNGQSHALNEAVRVGAFSAGKEAGREEAKTRQAAT